jgi:hypothetical protein
MARNYFFFIYRKTKTYWFFSAPAIAPIGVGYDFCFVVKARPHFVSLIISAIWWIMILTTKLIADLHRQVIAHAGRTIRGCLKSS